MQKISCIFLFSVFFFSCQKETKIANSKAAQNPTFEMLQKNWNLTIPSVSSATQKEIKNWNQWRQFEIEMLQKPKNNLTAFQLKTKNLVTKSDSLLVTLPPIFNQPQVRSRILVLNAKIKMLDTYLHLQKIPNNLVKPLFADINNQLSAIVAQWEEIIIINNIPKEDGEKQMIMALDTTRNANFDINKQEKIANTNEETNTPKQSPKPDYLINKKRMRKVEK